MKNRRGVTFGLLAVVLAGVLLLSGCVTIRSDTVINPDLSGYRSIIMAMDKSMMEMAMEGETEDPFADIESEFQDVSGATVEPYVDPATGNEGVKITIPFTDLNDMASQKFSEEDEGLDVVTWSQDGNVYTLNFAVNTGDLAASAQGSDAEDMSPEDEAMAAQMMAAMGLEISYSISLPGKILDYAPKDGATYDAANNSIVWTLDLANPNAGNIMVKWDNGAAPAAPSGAPVAAEQPASGMTVAASKTMAAEVQAYADAIMQQDRDAYVALMAGGQMIPHPLMSNSPELFQGVSYQVIYDSVFADDTMGAAEWTGTWTINGSNYVVKGVDILSFDGSGKVSAVESFVVPSEYEALKAVVQ